MNQNSKKNTTTKFGYPLLYWPTHYRTLPVKYLHCSQAATRKLLSTAVSNSSIRNNRINAQLPRAISPAPTQLLLLHNNPLQIPDARHPRPLHVNVIAKNLSHVLNHPRLSRICSHIRYINWNNSNRCPLRCTVMWVVHPMVIITTIIITTIIPSPFLFWSTKPWTLSSRAVARSLYASVRLPA